MPERHPQSGAPLRLLHLERDAHGSRLTLHVARFSELNTAALHGILRLRQDVFIVEQQCVYADIDGRDAEPGTVHVWIEEHQAVVSTLRVLDDGDGVHRIGRVATAPSHRNRGLAAALMNAAIDLAGPPIVLSAQAYLAAWYAGFGFREIGAGWIEDGIEHVPMRLG